MLANRIWQAIKSFLYDRTTPVQVVNAAYTTSASARPQVLSNGWIVSCEKDSDNYLYLQVSKDGGATFTPLCKMTSVDAPYFALASNGTKVYLLIASANNFMVSFFSIEATTVGNVNIYTTRKDLTTTETYVFGCSIAVNSSNGHLTAAWSSKNATYPNSFNIRSAKSTDGGVTWTKQNGTAGVDQITSYNTSGWDYASGVNVIYTSNGNPIIFTGSATTAPSNNISKFAWNGSAWNGGVVYSGGSYAQASPSATVQKYGANAGRIEVCWHGRDATDTAQYNIRYSYSDDNGATWSAMLKLTSGNTYGSLGASMTADLNGDTHICFTGVTSASSGNYYGRKIKKTSGSWGSVVDFSAENMLNSNLSTCDNYYNFENPITLFSVGAHTSVKFYGKWTWTP